MPDHAGFRPLTELPARLAEFSGLPAGTIRYRRCYNAVLDGVLPMVQQINGRWRFALADLPAIAAALGLEKKPARKCKRALAQNYRGRAA